MVRVAVFMSSGAYSPNGVSKYVGRLFSMKQWFIENGIELLGPYCGSTSFSDASIYTQSFAYKVKQTIKESLSLCKAGSMLAINKAYISHAREAVSRYRESGAPSFDIGLFNDPFTILAYNETTKDSFSDICYVTHDDGHFCKMLLDAFPKLPKVYVDDLRAKVFPICSRFIMVGGKNKEIFDLSYPEYSDRSVHIHTGIEPLCKNEAVDLNPDDHGIIKLITVGTVCARKNQLALVEAISNNRFDSRYSLTVVGNGPDLEACKRIVSERHAEHRVSLLGSRNDIGSLLCRSDAYISTSKDEGLPIAVLEAMSCGLPLLLTGAGGCEELIAENNGTLIKGSSVHDIEYALDQFWENRLELKSMGNKSKQLFFERYTLEVMCKEYLQLFNSLCEK